MDKKFDLTKKEDILLALKEDKEGLFAAKLSQKKFTDSISVNTVVKDPKVTKLDSSSAPTKSTVDVTVVCNAAWFCDSQMDVITGTAYDESVKNKGTNIPHIADHRQSSTAHVGDVTSVYTKDMPLRELGLDVEGTTTALIMESTVRKDYNEDVFKFYANGKINQHSIGLRYVDIKIAVNNNTEEYAEELAVWDEYYPKVINKEVVDKKGYFWVVENMDILENSCVLFGANSLTPTLSVKGSDVPLISVTKAKGNTMELEQALAEINKLQKEVSDLKADKESATKQAVKDEQTRVLGIIKAANTHKLPIDMAVKRIEKGTSVEDSIDMFEDIAESLSKSNHIDTEQVATTTVNTQTTENEADFLAAFSKAIDKVDSAEGNIDWGVK